MHLRNIVASFVGVVVKFIMFNFNMLNLLDLNIKLNGMFSIFLEHSRILLPHLSGI